MKNELKKTDDGTVELTITFPWQEIETAYKTLVDKAASQTEVAGFRKGKAPQKIVEEGLDKTKMYEETIRQLVPQAYTDAIKKYDLKPIMMPQIELKQAQEGKDWVLVAKTCEKPEVTLGDYQTAVAALKADKTPKLIVPGKEQAPDETKGPAIDEVLEAILKSSTVTVPGILVEHEVTHQLSQLVDQTKKLGLTVEQYLASTNKTQESIRKEYEETAQRNLALEFLLEAIADAEKVSVSDEEIQKILANAKNDEERKNLQRQRYYLTSLIRRQKTVDLLMK